jgi:hypothetical protein
MMVPSSYDEYVVMVNDLGDSILSWADPDHYRGHTEVSANVPLFGGFVCRFPT